MTDDPIGAALDGGSDATGELSWPLVDRRRRGGAAPTGSTGPDRRRASANLDDLAEANELLLALQRLSLTLPATLDLDRMLVDAESQVRRLVSPDRVFVLLRPRHVNALAIAVAREHPDPDADVPYRPLIGGADDRPLPVAIRGALTTNRSRRVELDEGAGLHADSREGIYSALRARGTIIGLIAVEWCDRGRADDRATELLTGVADALGLALDNAILFRTLRITGADDERRRLAREVHDRTGSSLAAIGFELDHLSRRLAEGMERGDAADAVRAARSHLDETLRDVREFLFDLRSEPVHDSDLDRLVREFGEHVGRRSGIAVDVRGDAPSPVPVEFARQVWSVIREAILNAERHASARALRISMSVSDGTFVVEIVDDGQGFDVDASRPGSYGLTGMRERAAVIAGELTLDSDSRGTRVRLRAPLVDVVAIPPNEGSE